MTDSSQVREWLDILGEGGYHQGWQGSEHRPCILGLAYALMNPSEPKTRKQKIKSCVSGKLSRLNPRNYVYIYDMED